MTPPPFNPTSGPTTLLIPSDIHAGMVAHCLRDAPLEACGLLIGRPGEPVSTLYPLPNASRSEVRYDADPHDLVRAYRYLRTRRLDIVAIYHSHPKWQAVPSRTDLAENHYGDVPRIIVSLLTSPPDVRAWHLEPTTYTELPYRITPR